MPIERLDGAAIRAGRADLVELLVDAVDGGSSVGFVAPMDRAVAAAFWDRVADEVAAGGRIVLVVREEDRIRGCVHLVLASQLNGLHRAEVQKLLVHRGLRRRGFGTGLLLAIERHARAAGRTVLVLDTERASGAESLYERLGWVRVGVIPKFALDSAGQGLIDTVVFSKVLEDSDARYREVLAAIEAEIEGEDDLQAVLSTVVCELHHAFGRFQWTGFYRVIAPDLLAVGPYQGGHGCLRIPFDQGVCGAAARTATTQLVPDVERFPGHIACSSTTRSEIVVPIRSNGAVVAVLDVDSDTLDAFGPVDQQHLEALCASLGARWSSLRR